MSLQKILELYELRLSLETYAVKRLTGKMDDAFFQSLDDLIAKQEIAVATKDIVRFVELDRRFHEAIIAGLNNGEYTEVMSRLHDKFLLAVRTTFYKNSDRLWGSLDEHKRIREALAGSDAALSERLMAEHIQFVKKVML